MQIGGIPNENNASSGSSQVRRQATKPDTRPVSTNTPATSSNSNDALRTQLNEIARLAAELKRIPEVRDEQVTAAMERYESGYYLTQEAAERTADRLTS
jgi:hypothetical protein